MFETVGHFLMELVDNFRLTNGYERKPITLTTYVIIIQREFETLWVYTIKLLCEHVFAYPKRDLMSVHDNKAWSWKIMGNHTGTHRFQNYILPHYFKLYHLAKKLLDVSNSNRRSYRRFYCYASWFYICDLFVPIGEYSNQKQIVLENNIINLEQVRCI